MQTKEVEKIEKIPQIRKYEMRQDTKEENKQLREQNQELKKQAKNTRTKNTRTKITPQQAYEMQQSSSSLKAKMIFKSEKEKVKEFKQGLSSKKGCAKYEKHLEDVANMSRMLNYTQKNQQDNSEHSGR